MSDDKAAEGRLDLSTCRIIDAPRALIWEALTRTDYLKRWWTPAPGITADCSADLRPGGVFYALMRSPDGTERAMNCIYLDIVPQERIVFTDTLQKGWRPSPTPFITAIITLEDHQGGTKYTVRALHKDEADRLDHEERGFEHGTNAVLDQLVDLLKSIKE